MPYCRRCGTQLEENAKFCHRCGLPVAGYIPPAHAPVYQYYPPPQPASVPAVVAPKKALNNRTIFLAVGLIIILVVASVAAALLFVPMTPWSYEKTLSDKTPNVDTLNLNFATNVGDISIMTLQVGSGAVLIHVQGNGSYSYLTKSEQPMTSTFDNQTAGNTLTVNSQVTVENAYTSGAAVTIQIYVDPSVKLNLNVTSITGKVALTGDRDSAFESLFLQSTTGSVEANLQDTVTLTGPVSLKTTTGAVDFRMHEIDVVGNNSLNLQTTTGDIGMDITEATQLHGNLAVNAHTTTGTIYVGLEVDAAVGAKITSTANLGQIRTDLTNFNGNKSPLTSSNYPSANNIEVTNTVGTGDVNITAKCQTTTIAS